MRIIRGDLLELAERGDFHIIVHGCNCFHAMRSGIAGQISFKYPGAAEVDRLTKIADKEKLGTFSAFHTGKFDIFNAYTQYTYSRYGDVFEYDAFKTVLELIKEEVIEIKKKQDIQEKISIGFPKIGCGLAGGSLSRVIDILLDFAEETEDIIEVTMVVYDDRR